MRAKGKEMASLSEPAIYAIREVARVRPFGPSTTQRPCIMKSKGPYSPCVLGLPR